MKHLLRLAVTVLLVLPLRAHGADAVDDEAARESRARLGRLARAVQAYRLIYGENPQRLSDLYYRGFAKSLSDFVEPGSPVPARSELDSKSEFALEASPGNSGPLVREKTARGSGQVLVGFADGSVKPITPGGDGAGGAGAKVARQSDEVATDRKQGGQVSRGGGAVVTMPNDRKGEHGKPGVTVTRSNDATLRKTGDEGEPIQLIDPDGVLQIPTGPVVARADGGADPHGPAAGLDPVAEEGTREDKAREPSGAVMMRGNLDAEQGLAMADMIYGRGGYDAALGLYEGVLAAEPRNEKALLGTGRAMIRTGALTAARKQFQKVLAADPGQLEARRSVATLDLVAGEIKRATITADALFHKQPNDPEVVLLHAQAALYGGDETEARRRFRTLGQASPGAAAEHRKLADEYRDQQFYKLATLEYATASALDPANDAALLGLGLAAAELKDKDRALPALTEYLRRHPNDEDAAAARAALQKPAGRRQ